MAAVTRRRVLQTAGLAASGLAMPLMRTAGAAVGPAPAGSMTLAWHTNIAPRWLDPLQHDGSATPDWVIPANYYEKVVKDGFAQRPIGSRPT